MATVTSNRDEVVAELKRNVASLGYNGKGHNHTLGNDVVDFIAQTVIDRTVNRGLAAGGIPLAPLKPASVARKRRLGYPEDVLVEKGLMLSQYEVAGEREVTRDSVTLTYGKGERAKEEAEWAAEGSRGRRGRGRRRGTGKRPKRPFFGMTGDDLKRLDGFIAEGLDAQVNSWE